MKQNFDYANENIDLTNKYNEMSQVIKSKEEKLNDLIGNFTVIKYSKINQILYLISENNKCFIKWLETNIDNVQDLISSFRPTENIK